MLQRRYTPGPFVLSYLFLLASGLIVGFLLFVGVSYLQAIPPIAEVFSNSEATVRSNALTIALTATGGFAVVAGLYVNYRKQRNEEAAGVRDQDRIFTERFNAAAALLSSEAAAVRLSGVSSLVRLADDSFRDREACLSTLCAYLRLPVALKESAPDDQRPDVERLADRSQWLDSSEWEVRRTVLNVVITKLDRNGNPRHHWKTDLVDFDGAVLIDLTLVGARFDAELKFQRVTVVGDFSRVAACTFTATVSWNQARFLCQSGFDSCIFEQQVFLFGARFFDRMHIYRCVLKKHLSAASAQFDDKFVVAESTLAGYVTFTRASWSGLALFRETDFAELRRRDAQEASASSPPVTDDALDFNESVLGGGLRLQDCIGHVYLCLRSSKISGVLDASVDQVDLRGADLSGVVVDPTGPAFRPGKVCMDADTRLPDGLVLDELSTVAPPVHPAGSRSVWS